jgi:hypothetical protein
MYWSKKVAAIDWSPQKFAYFYSPWPPAIVQAGYTEVDLFVASGEIEVYPWSGPKEVQIYWTFYDYRLSFDNFGDLQPPVGLPTSRAPAAAAVGDRVYIAVRGARGDENIWWTYLGSPDPPRSNTSVGTSNGPALAAYQAPSDPGPRRYMAWRGADQDQTVYWSKLNEDTQVWDQQNPVRGAGTSNNPALAVYRGQLYLVFNGGASDSNVYWSVFDPAMQQWSYRQPIPGAGTDGSPAAAAFDDRLYAAWKGVGDDKNIWWSTFDGQSWLPSPNRIGSVGTTAGPALCAYTPPPSHFYTSDPIERQKLLDSGEFNDEGIACWVYAAQAPGPVPFYRARSLPTGAHFYTTSIEERDNATNHLDYEAEGIACYIGGDSSFGRPLYRAYRPASDDHFYTIDKNEHDRAVMNLGYSDEGIAGYVQPGARADVVPLYRMVKETHFYTISWDEYQNAIGNLHFTDEEIACYVWASPPPGPVPLFRTRHVLTDCHFYTTFIDLRDEFTNSEYVGEGIACYVDAQKSASNVPLYVAVNGAGDWFYTTSLPEHNNAIQNLGYQEPPFADLFPFPAVIGYVLPGGASPGTEPLYRLGPVTR